MAIQVPSEMTQTKKRPNRLSCSSISGAVLSNFRCQSITGADGFRKGDQHWPENVQIVDQDEANEMLEKEREELAKQEKKKGEDDDDDMPMSSGNMQGISGTSIGPSLPVARQRYQPPLQ